ncbi:MAG: phosphomannomutase/phosphoglucomutase [Firmicutes bacterium]|nr:phosphomannomutase/phosphoglucomutase [Bacillota bacterium]
MKDYKKLQNGSDIRGIAMDTVPGEPVGLTVRAAQDLGASFALWLSQKLKKAPGELTVALGRDSRLSGEELLEAFASGLASEGAKALCCGMASTPAMFMATVFDEVKADGSVMVTASHLPSNRNGFKFFTREGGLGKKDIAALIAGAEAVPEKDFPKADSRECGLMDLYCAHLRGVICGGLGAREEDRPLAGLHVCVDAGNGAGGFYAGRVLEPLGADCTGSRYLEPDGSFPNHQPNPENKEAMKAVCEAVKESGADLGIIFDTDVDRAAAVDSKARPIDRNAVVAVSAVIASQGHPCAVIVTDSITSSQLHEFLEARGLEHLRFKRGYKNVIDKGVELNAEGKDCVLAIETSGHAAMRENYFLDDGAYLATRIVVEAAKLKKEGKGVEALIEGLEEPLETSEFRLPVTAEDFAAYADRVIEHIAGEVGSGRAEGLSLEQPNYEGVRVKADEAHGDGWFVIRKSLHEPLMPLNIESSRKGGLEMIKESVCRLIEGFDLLDHSLLK